MSKRVVMIVRTSVVHDSRVLREAGFLLDNGNEVTIIGIKDTGKEPSYFKINGISVYLVKVWSKKFLPPCLIGWMIKYLEYLLKVIIKTFELKPDILHCHDLDGLLPGYLVREFQTCNLIYDSHELYTETATIGKTEKRISIWLEKRLIAKCDSVITVSDSIAEELVKRYQIKKPTVLLNCPDCSKKIPKTNKIRQKLHLSEQEPIILYQGAFLPHRGLDKLIRALNYIPSGVLVFMGSGVLRDDLLKQAEQLPERFFILDPVLPDDIIKWSASADVGIVVSENTCLNNFYSLPNKLFEYIHANLPVVVSDFPDMGNLVTKYLIGEVCDPSDPESIAKAINKIINNHLHYSKPEKFDLINSQINWEIQASKLLNIYQNLS